MKAKGLLRVAASLDAVTVKNEDSTQNTHIQPSVVGDGKKVDTPLAPVNKEGPNKAEEIPENIILVATPDTGEEKLLSFAKWKDLATKQPKPTTNSIHKYEHELISYSSWKNKVEDKYKEIKKVSQSVLPELTITELDEADLEEVFPENGLEELPAAKQDTEINPNYDFDILADLIRSTTGYEGGKEPIATTVQEEKTSPAIEPQNSPNLRKKIIVRRKKRTVFADIFTVLICSISAAICIYYFLESFNRIQTKADEEPIAVITFKYKSAQRKFADRVLWDRVKQNSPIYNGDIIRTADLSEATIMFNDGSAINLYEQSLAQFFYDEDGAAIDFSGGKIAVDSSSDGLGIKLSNRDITVKIESGSELVASAKAEMIDGVFSADTLEPMTLQVTNGEASLLSSEGLENLSIEEGDVIMVSSDGKDAKEPPVSIFSPEQNAKYLALNSDSMAIDFNWTVPSDSTEPYTFELSRKKDFSEIDTQSDVTGLNHLSLSLAEGMWYWRIYSQLPVNGTEGKFRIIDSSLPTTIIPSYEDEYYYTTRLPSIRFMWTEDVYASQWLFEVADNEQMQNPIISQVSTQTSSMVNTLEKGRWYWRVSPVYPKGVLPENITQAPSSNISSFAIHQREGFEAVKLVMPAKNEFVDKQKNTYFSWDHDSEASHYTINLSRKSDMSSTLLSQNVQQNYYVLSNDENISEVGMWYWTVTKTDSEGNISPLGEVRSFFVLEGSFAYQPLSPKENDIVIASKIEGTVFEWENNLPYNTFLEVSDNELFDNLIISEQVHSNSIDGISLPVGEWYWRIITKNSEIGFEYATQPQKFFVEYDLESVAIEQPAENETLIVNPLSRVVFSWDSVENAQYYELFVYLSTDTQNAVYESQRIEGTTHSLSMYDMSKGSYVLSLRAVIEDTPSGNIRKSVVSMRNFSTREIEPIRLVSPAPIYEIDGVSALIDPVSVRWVSSERVVTSEFILSRSERGLSASSRQNGVLPQNAQVRQRISDPSATIRLPMLDEGIWYWTVVGTTEKGYDITATQPRRIVVNPIEKLPAARLNSPTRGRIFDVEYLSTTDYIDFSWEAVPYADSYVFTLYGLNNEVIIERDFNNTSFQIDDLSVFDRGTFTWTIEALRSLPNDTIQNSIIATESFVIDLPRITVPQNKTTGDLYGL